MTHVEILSLVSYVALVLTVVLSATYLVPFVARARFVRRVQDIRDRVADDQLDGRLPVGAVPVDTMVGFTTWLTKSPEQFSLSWTWALIAAFGVPAGDTDELFSYADLGPNERRRMHGYDAELVIACRQYLLYGSHLWFAVATLRKLSHVGSMKRRIQTKVPTTRAMDYVREAANEKYEAAQHNRMLAV